MRLVLSLSDDLDPLLVERAIAEIRAARPVVIDREGERALVLGIEDLDPEQCVRAQAGARGEGRLVLPPARLRRLGLDRQQPGTVALPVVDPARIETLALKIDGRVDAPVSPASGLDEDAL